MMFNSIARVVARRTTVVATANRSFMNLDKVESAANVKFFGHTVDQILTMDLDTRQELINKAFSITTDKYPEMVRPVVDALRFDEDPEYILTLLNTPQYQKNNIHHVMNLYRSGFLSKANYDKYMLYNFAYLYDILEKSKVEQQHK